jgi:hypothetical protein
MVWWWRLSKIVRNAFSNIPTMPCALRLIALFFSGVFFVSGLAGFFLPAQHMRFYQIPEELAAPLTVPWRVLAAVRLGGAGFFCTTQTNDLRSWKALVTIMVLTCLRFLSLLVVTLPSSWHFPKSYLTVDLAVAVSLTLAVFFLRPGQRHSSKGAAQ